MAGRAGPPSVGRDARAGERRVLREESAAHPCPALLPVPFDCRQEAQGRPLLDSRAALLKGGESGAVILPGSPAKSRLIEAIQYKNIDLRMPPRGKLSNAAIAD